MKRYKYSVLIGRFQPVHKAHIEIIKQSLDFSDNILIVLGSSQASRNIKNPFSDVERVKMITKSLVSEGIDEKCIVFTHVRDQIYSLNGWLSDLKRKVTKVLGDNNFCLIGHHKDESSFYLDHFPKWKVIEMENVNDNLSSSMVREAYFGMGRILDELPSVVKDFLNLWKKTSTYLDLAAEYNFIQSYKAGWANAPYAPFFYNLFFAFCCLDNFTFDEMSLYSI